MLNKRHETLHGAETLTKLKNTPWHEIWDFEYLSTSDEEDNEEDSDSSSESESDSGDSEKDETEGKVQPEDKKLPTKPVVEEKTKEGLEKMTEELK